MNTNKKCCFCKEEILNDALVCKHCTKTQPIKITKEWWQIIIGSFLVFILATMLVTSLSFNNSKEVFNVPSLLNKSLVELETTLGVPSENKEPPTSWIKYSEIRTWNKSWHKDGFSLSVFYNFDTNKVEDLFLGINSEESIVAFQDRENILKVGNLSTNDPHYSVDFIKARNADGYTGATIKTRQP